MAEKIIISEIRQKVLQELPKDTVCECDVERWEKDDKWVEKFLHHHDMNVEQASKMAAEAMQWRKEFQINSLTPNIIPKYLMQLCGVYIATQDKEGHRILVMQGKDHDKNSKKLPHQKNFVAYWVEKIEKESNGGKITLLLDMREAGLKNLDWDFLKFFFNLFILYYPDLVEHILVFESAWILSAAWKLIKSWFNPKLANSMKFVSKATIKEYIDDEELPERLGGKSPFEPAWDGSGAD